MKGGSKYRKMQNELDKIGFITAIIKNGRKNYAFILNGQIIKVFAKRDSCNKRIVKLYETMQIHR